jgi:hypothetical protein
MMDQSKLIWSPIQLRLENQHKIVPVRRLTGVSLNIDGLRSVSYFEVIKILDENTPYPTLLGFDWAFDNQTIIDFKNIWTVFEVDELKVATPLDPTEGIRYVEPAKRK